MYMHADDEDVALEDFVAELDSQARAAAEQELEAGAVTMAGEDLEDEDEDDEALMDKLLDASGAIKGFCLAPLNVIDAFRKCSFADCKKLVKMMGKRANVGPEITSYLLALSEHGDLFRFRNMCQLFFSQKKSTFATFKP